MCIYCQLLLGQVRSSNTYSMDQLLSRRLFLHIYLVMLFDPATQKTLDNPVHVNRLKHAYVRAPKLKNQVQKTYSVYRDQAVHTSHVNQDSDGTNHSQVMSDDFMRLDHMTSTQETQSESVAWSESSVPPTVDPNPHSVSSVSSRPRRPIRNPPPLPGQQFRSQ